MKRLNQRHSTGFKGVIYSVLVFAVIMALLIGGSCYFERIGNSQNLDLTRQSVRRATVQCYAVEGIYPADLKYLEDNYGLIIDHNRYYVEYDCFASNIMPSIEVYEKY